MRIIPVWQVNTPLLSLYDLIWIWYLFLPVLHISGCYSYLFSYFLLIFTDISKVSFNFRRIIPRCGSSHSSPQQPWNDSDLFVTTLPWESTSISPYLFDLWPPLCAAQTANCCRGSGGSLAAWLPLPSSRLGEGGCLSVRSFKASVDSHTPPQSSLKNTHCHTLPHS